MSSKRDLFPVAKDPRRLQLLAVPVGSRRVVDPGQTNRSADFSTPSICLSPLKGKQKKMAAPPPPKKKSKVIDPKKKREMSNSEIFPFKTIRGKIRDILKQ